MTFLFFLIFQSTLHFKFRSSYMEEVKSSYSKTPLQQRPYNKMSKGPAQWTIYFNDVQYKIPLPLKTLESPFLSCNRIWLLVWIVINFLVFNAIYEAAVFYREVYYFLAPLNFFSEILCREINFLNVIVLLLSYLSGVAFRCEWGLKSPRKTLSWK